MPACIDLSAESPSRVHGRALEAVEALRAGASVRLLVLDDPALLMEALDNHLRGGLAWVSRELASGGHEVRVSLRADTEPRDVVDLLERDHRRLDALLARALAASGAGLAAECAASVPDFARALRAHVAIEDDLLLTRLGGPREPAPFEPAGVMKREHAELLVQLAALEECHAFGVGEPAEAGIYLGLISGMLAKHEYREETQLFPQWRTALARLDPQASAALVEAVAARLGG